MTQKPRKGGEFVLLPACSQNFFVPEQLSSEQLEIGKVAAQFVEREVVPKKEELEDPAKKYELSRKLMRAAGEQGLHMLEIPEKYGGLGLGLVASAHVADVASLEVFSFTATWFAHLGIGTLPILYFGTEQQKQKYLPRLATGEIIAAYALTESNHGSDALGAKTKATLTADGKHYILNGEKIFITNAGFADLFTVYAKIDGKDFSAFIVERNFPGVSIGPEENKMGLHGSSTCSVLLEDAKVPVENLLGEPGQGHKSALGVLDIGRFKLGMACVGGSKRLLQLTAQYANERKQFGKPLSHFGMIRRKFADMTSWVYAAESAAYRIAGLLDTAFSQFSHDHPDYTEKCGKILEEYDLECSIIKVLGSEVGHFVADEAVQIYGGYGYIEEYPIAAVYRDQRINRIFEGTNEINRLLLPTTILKRSMTGRLPAMPEFAKLTAKLKGQNDLVPTYEGFLAPMARTVESCRLTSLYCFGSVVRTHIAKLQQPDFALGYGEYFFERLADMFMDVFAMDSAVQRARMLAQSKGEAQAEHAANMATIVVTQAANRVFRNAEVLMSALARGDESKLQVHRNCLRKLRFLPATDLISIQDKVADKILRLEKYVV